jgi:hypothetical protein
MLLELESKGNEVYYVAPAFHELDELNAAYLNHQVRRRSIWIRPTTIGALTDDKEHHVAFQVPGPVRVCSEPRKIDMPTDFGSFERHLEAELRRPTKRTDSADDMELLAEQLYEIGQQRREIGVRQRDAARRELLDRRPVDRVAYYAAMFFGVQLFVVTKRDA